MTVFCIIFSGFRCLLCTLLTFCFFSVRGLLLPHSPFSSSFNVITRFASFFMWIISSLMWWLAVVRYEPSRLYDSIRWINVSEGKEFSPFALQIDFVRFVDYLSVSRKYSPIRSISYFLSPIFSNIGILNLQAFSSFYSVIAYN